MSSNIVVPSQMELFNNFDTSPPTNPSSSSSSSSQPKNTQQHPKSYNPRASVDIPSLNPPQTQNQTSYSTIAKKVHREVRFGSYILGSTLGEGEFGKVKLGWRKDGKHPSQVAIKLIKRSTLMKDSDSEIKIHREINSLKLLNHPNIVNLVEVMKSGKYIGIVLEYCSGGELFDYILQHKYLKENIAKKLFAQLVSGVDYMHSKGLIHRDLKLENLLLDKHKNVIISDFGFVNSYNKDRNDLMKTSCGSPCYAAPELVLTQSPYEGRKVDIWSLGVILYAMLSGYLPFDDDPENEDGSDIIKLYHYICKTPLTFPEYVSPLARDLLRKIIVSDPRNRIDMNEIKQHPWLSQYSNLFQIKLPEWDRLQQEHKPPVVENKRFSMINERTNSSSILSPQPISLHNRSYSSTSISLLYSSPSSTVAIPKLNESNDTINMSSTPSPKKTSPVSPQKGHQKSVSISNSYSSASIALKALDYKIPTIVESPTKQSHSPQIMPSQRLPPTKKPRPTSYHPSSMTCTLTNENKIGQFISSSPPKHTQEIAENTDSGSHHPISRRNSEVTHIHVNGVLSNEENKRNSVLSYLEGKIDTLELESPKKEGNAEEKIQEYKPQVTVQPQSTDPGVKPEVESKSESEAKIEIEDASPIVPVEEYIAKSEESKKTHSKRYSVANTKPNEHKKKNRFSLLSFYSTSNTSSMSLKDSTNMIIPQQVKKPLESSNESNKRRDPQKRVHSNSSSNSKKTIEKESSAARKVMDFFKRRSIRVN